MSFIGTKPFLPFEYEEYKNYYQRIFTVKPGATGLWANKPFDSYAEYLNMELFYVENMSLLLDIKILFKTFWIVLSGDGGK
jgi:lipopolysaccharide/colanic/teichoic acid biosynthesis glycosyltransferase